MIGYFDPDSLIMGETDGVITFINAANGGDVKEVRITTPKQAKQVIAALKDQMEYGIAGLEGRFRKVQGTYSRIPGNNQEGIIVDPSDKKETPIRIGFDIKPHELPHRGICVAIGEMVDGALIVDRMTVAPIAPMPSPQQSISTPDG